MPSSTRGGSGRSSRVRRSTARGRPAHVGERPAHGRQGRCRPADLGKVVEADDAQVLRHPQSAQAQRLDGAERHLVAGREDGRRRFGQAQQGLAGREAGLVAEVAGDDQGLVDGDARALQGGAVAVAAVPRAEQPWRPGDQADPAVSQRQQVLGGRQGARPVGGADGGHVRGGRARRVDDDQRDAEDPQLLVEHGVQGRGDEDDAVGGPGPQIAHPLTGVARASADRGDHGADPGGVGHLLDPADDLHGPGAVQVVEDQVDQVGPAAGRRGALAVPVPAQQFLHPRPGPGRHVRAAVHDPGHGRHRDARAAGDVRDRDPAPAAGRRYGPGLVCCHFPTPADTDRENPRSLPESGRAGEGVPGQETGPVVAAERTCHAE